MHRDVDVHPPKDHVHRHVRMRLAGPMTGEHKFAVTLCPFQLPQYRDGAPRERHPVLTAGLHPLLG
jgi:hypothetical protein